MHIQEMRIARFGILREQEARLSPGMSIFLGNNEAGKSTCLKFFQAMFFGYKRANRSIEPIFSGAAGKKGKAQEGGSIVCSTKSRGIITVARQPGSSGGLLHITGQNSEPLPGEVLDELLPGLNSQVYDSIFAFDLADLMAVDSFRGKDKRVRDALHGAAFGTGFRSPAEVLKELEKGLGDILRSRSGGKINLIVESLEEVEDRLEVHRAAFDQYEALKEQIEETEALLAKHRDGLREQEALLRGVERRISAWPAWERLSALQAEKAVLESRPEFRAKTAFSPDSVERLERLISQREERRLALAAEEESLSRLERELADAPVEERVADMGGTLAALLEQKQSRREEARAIPRLMQEALTLFEKQQAVLGQFGPDWDRKRVFATDCSLFVKNEISRARGRLDALRANTGQKRASFESIKKEREKAEQALASSPTFSGSGGEGQEAPGVFVPGPSVPEASVLEATRADLARARAYLSGLPLLESRAEEAKKDLEAAIAEISPGWDAAKLSSFDLSLRGRQALREKGEALKSAAIARDACWRDRALADTGLAAAEARSRETAERLAGYESLPDLEQAKKRQAILRDLENTWISHQAANRAQERTEELARHFAKQAAGRGGFDGLLAASVFLGAGSIALYLAGLTVDPLFFGPSFGLFLLGACVFLWRTARDKKGEEQYRSEERPDSPDLAGEEGGERLSRLKSLLVEVSTWEDGGFNAYPVPEGPNGLRAAFFDRWREIMEKQLERLTLRERDLDERKKAEAQVHEALMNCERVEAVCMGVQEELERAESVWEASLADRDLPVSLPPGAYDALFAMVEAARAKSEAYSAQARQVEEAREFISSLVRRAGGDAFFRGYLQKAGTEPGSLLDALGSALGESARLLEEQREQRVQQRMLEDRKDALDALQKSEEAAREAFLGEEAALGAELSAWQAWLEEKGLAPDLTPETAGEALRLLEGYMAMDKDRQAMEEQAKAAALSLGDYLRAVAALAANMGAALPGWARLEPQEGQTTSFDQPKIPTAGEHTEIALIGLPEQLLPDALHFLDDLALRVRNLDEARVKLAEKQVLFEERQSKKAEAQRALEATGEALKSLFDAAGVDDEEAFRQAFYLWKEVTGLEARAAEGQASLLSVAREEGLEQDDLAAGLSLTNLESLHARKVELDLSIASLRDEVAGLSERAGDKKARLEALERDEGEELHRKKAMLQEDLFELSRQWSVEALARHLLEKAKKNFEEKHQTGVIRHASELFADITGGEYSGIYAPLGEDVFFAISRHGAHLDPEKELSQGTREQLYLSLRLAYIKNHAEQAGGEAVPVIMDEVLVNFDPERTRRSARALARFARENQILFFTCHPQTAEILMKEARDEAESTLDSKGFPPALIKVRQGVLEHTGG